MWNSTIIGHISQDASTKNLESGNKVTEFSVATNYFVKDGVEHVTFIRVTMWGEWAEKRLDKLQKGTKVCINGQTHVREYTTKEGKPGYSVELQVGSWRDIDVLLPPKDQRQGQQNSGQQQKKGGW